MVRSWFVAVVVLALLAALRPGSALGATTAAADTAYQEAKDAYAKLKGDAKRRQFRHHWLNVAARFEKVAQKHAKTDRAPEALFNAAELYNELSKFSRNDDDLAASAANYKKLLDGFPKHRLGDDAAWGLGRLLADRLDDPQGARKVLQRGIDLDGDKQKEMKKLLAALPAPKAPAPLAKQAEKRDEKKDEKKPEPVKVAKPAATPHKPVPLDAALEEEDDGTVKPASAAFADAFRRAATTTQATLEQKVGALKGGDLEEREEPAPAKTDAVVEGENTAALPRIADLQERLRDVRVGVPEEKKVDDAVAKKRLKQVAKDNAGSELTLAEQLGLKMKRVIIDAGHGGHDTGAIGPSGVQEKDVSLAIALEVARQLEAAGLEVVLTRDDDTYVKLEDRTRVANKQRGDLFVSIHCNAAPSKKMRGIETYTLNTSADRYSIRLAARENASTERGVNDLQFILADLATKSNTEESAHLASRVQSTLVSRLGGKHKGIKNLGTKEALFFVLLGAKMPAILVETSFLSHPEEEKLLGSKEYQKDVASSISEAVQGFIDERQGKLARID